MKPYTAKEMADRTATYTIPPMAATNIVIDITDGCEYCKTGKYFMQHNGVMFEAWGEIEQGVMKVSYNIHDNGGNWLGSKGVKINYCPMCGRKF